jgi:hypothetical protein
MSAREELAAIIDDRWHGYGYNPQGAADAVLAAGWRPPAVTIKTEMGLQALVDGIVLLDADGDVYRKNTTLDHDGTPIAVFWQAGPQGRFRTVALPATVLYEP